MNLLAIDTSTTRGSVAVLLLGEIVFDQSFLADRHHSALLFPVLEGACACGAEFDRIAVGLGPGSYAGVRIAIAAAIGLQLRFQAKLVGIPSVSVLAPDLLEYLAIGDARRGSFHFTHVRDQRAIEGPLLETESALRARLEVYASLPLLSSEPLRQFANVSEAYPVAAQLARLAAEGIGIVAEENLEPIYLREPHITQPRPAPRR